MRGGCCERNAVLCLAPIPIHPMYPVEGHVRPFEVRTECCVGLIAVAASEPRVPGRLRARPGATRPAAVGAEVDLPGVPAAVNA